MVAKLTDNMYQNANKELCHRCLQIQPNSDRLVVVCKPAKDIDKKMPSQCHENSLQLDIIPEKLSDLCELKYQLISKCIPFMKIVNLLRAAQKGIRGAVDTVPTDLRNVSALPPRTMSDSGILAVKLKRQLYYAGHVNYQTVRTVSLQSDSIPKRKQ